MSDTVEQAVDEYVKNYKWNDQAHYVYDVANAFHSGAFWCKNHIFEKAKTLYLKDAPQQLNTNDKAFWLLGYNEAIERIKKLSLMDKP